jgi:hypothetical protein
MGHDSSVPMPDTVTTSAPKTNPALSSNSRAKHRSSSVVLVGVGVFVCLLNIGAAWWLIQSSNKFVMTSLIGDSKSPSATKEALIQAQAPTATWEKLIFLDRIVENDLNHRNVANKQTAVIVAMASSFSLVAIGFALFVMGVEAAYTISGTSPTTGNLVIQATSPGLACFVLAAIVTCVAITRQTEVSFSPMELSQNPSPESTPSLPTPVVLGPKYSGS